MQENDTFYYKINVYYIDENLFTHFRLVNSTAANYNSFQNVTVKIFLVHSINHFHELVSDIGLI